MYVFCCHPFLGFLYEMKINALYGDHVSPSDRLPVWDLVSASNPCRIFMKIGIEIVYTNVSNQHEFYENRLSEVILVRKA
jgi:hypothetical protein